MFQLIIGKILSPPGHNDSSSSIVLSVIFYCYCFRRIIGPIYQSKHGQSYVPGRQDPVAVQHMQEAAPPETCYIRSCRTSPE